MTDQTCAEPWPRSEPWLSDLSGSLCESLVHSRYIWFNSANREDERRGRRGPDGARWSPPTIRRGTGHRVGTMRDGFEHRLDVRRDEHLPTNLSSTTTTPSLLDGASMLLVASLGFGTTPIVDGRTQCMPLSAAVVNRRSAGRIAGT